VLLIKMVCLVVSDFSALSCNLHGDLNGFYFLFFFVIIFFHCLILMGLSFSIHFFFLAFLISPDSA
jgi:hypothetical protein